MYQLFLLYDRKVFILLVNICECFHIYVYLKYFHDEGINNFNPGRYQKETKKVKKFVCWRIVNIFIKIRTKH